jgi:hypothetical protein
VQVWVSGAIMSKLKAEDIQLLDPKLFEYMSSETV